MYVSSTRQAVAPRWLACAIVLALSACGTRHVSRDISPVGAAAGIVFPDPADVLLDNGTFPDRDDLRAIGTGITKTQLYGLVGRPHFREGLRAREWDYLFHFRGEGGITTCQYKVIFDREYKGRSFHWAPASCAALLESAVPASTSTAAARVSRFDLSGDALFAFDRHAASDMLSGGREQIAAIAAQLKGSDITSIQVTGHTDTLGSDAYNRTLSQQRAQSVRRLLLEHGVAPAKITTSGAGSSQPVEQCDPAMPQTARIACEQPNRRVEIVAHGQR